MQVTLVGLGCGTAATMTQAGLAAVTGADCLVGAARVLDALGGDCTPNRHAATRAEDIFSLLQGGGWKCPCVVYSGDTGFYSGANSLLALLEQAGVEPTVVPGISSVQWLSARLARPWQDWTLVSAHGTDCDAVAAVSQGKPAFFLTGGRLTPAILCQELTAAGLGQLPVTVGERLSYADEHITTGAAASLAQRDFDSLSVLLAEPAPRPYPRRCAGFPDGAFLRGDVPMTKQEVRAAALAKLGVRPTDTVWDVGAGTGSVSVELYAVECEGDAFALMTQNRQRLGAWNLSLVHGAAPAALADLPAPDAAFIGGSKGNLRAIVDTVLAKNPAARLCVSAIALETLGEAVAALTAHGIRPDVTQLSVSRSREAGALHLLMANNPVFLISGGAVPAPEGGL